jgi:tetratricopeptide (TPR) repeat protein
MLKIYQLALETFSSGLKYDSKSGKMLNGMGVTYYNLENFEGALFYYGQALLSEPTNQMFFNNKFTLLIKQGKFDELLQFCSFYIECYPKDAYYYYKRGIVYELHLKNYEKALSDYNSALSLESDNPEFYYQRGSVYSILNRLDESIHDLDQAISLSPDIYYLKMKAAIFHDYNHLEKAISEYNKILKLEPDNSDLHLCRSQAYTTLGFIDAALKDVNKSIEIAPYKAESYYRRAILYREKKNVEYALMDINMAISLAPSDVTFKNFKTSLSTGYKA